MTGGAWPFHGDGPTAIARKVAGAYRAALVVADPNAAAVLDARMAAFGQRWIVPTLVTVSADDWLDSNAAAEYAGINPPTLREWRRRGRVTGRPAGRRWQYQVAALDAAIAGPRPRR